MITFRCGRCTAPLRAAESEAGRAVMCDRCGHANVCPPPFASSVQASRPPIPESSRDWQMTRTLSIAVGIVVLAGASWMAWSQLDSPGATAAASSLSPADALQQELLKQDLGKPGDPALDAMYQDISTQYFKGALPSLPVMWEPGLARVGELTGESFTLEGMFGHVGKQALILLNPALQDDQAALERALCHEIVHAYLWSTGDTSTDHGPAFQAVLEGLSKAGAFEGIAASEAERTNLRAWLDTESARLDTEHREMDQVGQDLEHERVEVEKSMDDLNARISAASAEDRPGPSEAEIAEITARRDAYNQRVIEANDRTLQDSADLDHFNSEVARYNLMLVYPDGIETSARVAPKTDQTSHAGGQ